MVTGRGGGDEAFSTTLWSLVRAAALSDSPESRAALEELCRVYWPPVHSFLRRRGHDDESARDLTQGFFAELLDKKRLGVARPERGRFRSFLLASVKNFAANERSRSRALKRGGGERLIRLDVRDADTAADPHLADHDTPERVFEVRWALTLLRRVQERLDREMEGSPGFERYRHLKPFIRGDASATYREVAAELGLTESNVKVTVHRLRGRFGRILREEVAQTVDDPALIDHEIRFLLEVLAS